MDRRRYSFPDPSAPTPRRLPAALRDPLRIAILVGLVVLLIGDLLPWLRVWLPYRGFFEVSGFENAGDAGLILELSLVVFALTFSDQAWNSRTTVLVAGPAVLGAVIVLVLRNAWADGQSYIRSLHVYGGYGDVLPWFWLAALGAAIVTTCGAIEVWRARGRISFRIGIARTSVAGAVGGVAGAIGGFLAGVRISELFTSGDIAVVQTSALVLLAIALAFLGAYVGAIVGAGLARSTRRP